MRGRGLEGGGDGRTDLLLARSFEQRAQLDRRFRQCRNRFIVHLSVKLKRSLRDNESGGTATPLTQEAIQTEEEAATAAAAAAEAEVVAPQRAAEAAAAATSP
jgi:hypothetical protein